MSLAELKGPAEVEVEILMSRLVFDGAFLIVEGNSEFRFFQSRVDKAACAIVTAGGKPAVIGGVDRLNTKTLSGFLGIVDDDCDSIDGRCMVVPNLIAISDTRDLDAFLVWSPALNCVLGEYASLSHIQRLGETSVRERLVGLALPFGSLRRWSYATSAGIDFKSLPPSRFVTPEWQFDPSELYEAAAKQLEIESGCLVSEVDGLSTAHPRLVCHGHDLIDILAIGLRKGGILGSSNPGSATIAAALRLSMDSGWWQRSSLARAIVAWETGNPPYRVLVS